VESGSTVRLRIVECGDPHASNVVVCVHGWACLVYTFRRIMLQLADAGLRVVALDLPGHGLSDKPSDGACYTIDAMTAVLAHALDAVNVRRALFVGHSMGGGVATRLAVLHPERVQALVLAAPAGFRRTPLIRLAMLLSPPLVTPVLPYCIPKWGVKLVRWFAYGSLYKLTAHDVEEYWAATHYPAFMPAMRRLLHTFDWRAGERGAFDGLSLPCVIIRGGRDPLVDRRAAEGYARTIAGAALQCVDGSGHVVPEEAPGAVVDAVLDLVTK